MFMKKLRAFVFGAFALLLCGAAATPTGAANGGRNNQFQSPRAETALEVFARETTQRRNVESKRQKSKTRQKTVKVFLVAVGDNGKTGRKIGCDDSLVAVRRTVKPSRAVLKSAVEELLKIPRNYNEKLENFWGGGGLKLKSVALAGGVATIRLTGKELPIAGVCDQPRVARQIEETAKQFPAVKRVRVFVNGKTLAQVIE